MKNPCVKNRQRLPVDRLPKCGSPNARSRMCLWFGQSPKSMRKIRGFSLKRALKGLSAPKIANKLTCRLDHRRDVDGQRRRCVRGTPAAECAGSEKARSAVCKPCCAMASAGVHGLGARVLYARSPPSTGWTVTSSNKTGCANAAVPEETGRIMMTRFLWVLQGKPASRPVCWMTHNAAPEDVLSIVKRKTTAQRHWKLARHIPRYATADGMFG